MDSMREVLRRSLGRSLEAMQPLDRLRAAWPVACGKLMASRGEVIALVEGVVHVHVPDSLWFQHMLSQRETLERELGRIARVKLTGIHFTATAPQPPRRDTL